MSITLSNKSKSIKLVAALLIVCALFAAMIPMTTNAATTKTISGTGNVTVETGKGWGVFYVFNPQVKIRTNGKYTVTVMNNRTGAIESSYSTSGTLDMTVKLKKNSSYTICFGNPFGALGSRSATVSNGHSCTNIR